MRPGRSPWTSGASGPAVDLAERFAVARETASAFGIHLVDWLACDGDTELIQSTRLALEPGSKWWDVL